MADQKTTEDSFRESLKDLVTITQKLNHYCESTSDLTAMVNLALDNDSQLRLLMSIVTAPASKSAR